MPTYEYRCKDCGTELEVVQAFTDDALTTCEACGGALRKVFGNVGIAFKGSGFYKNDSRGSKAAGDGGDTKKAEPATNGSSDKSSTDTSSSDKGSSDKKPAEKKTSDKGAAKPTPAASSST